MSLAAAIAARPVAFPVIAHANGCNNCAARPQGFCAAVKAESLARFSLAHTSQDIKAGKTFLNEGDPATHFFTITEGTVKLFKLLSDGRRAVTGFLFPGDLFGFSVEDKYSYSAESVTPVSLCRFPRRQLDRMNADFPGLESQILKLVSRELAAAQDQMVLLGRKTAHERVASFLLALVRRQSRPGRYGGWIELSMTRTDIADYLGLTTETVSRVFTVLKGSGCIVLACSKVRIADTEALEELADGIGGDDE